MQRMRRNPIAEPETIGIEPPDAVEDRQADAQPPDGEAETDEPSM